MGIDQFKNTISIINRNPYTNVYSATIKHCLWQFRKFFDLFPCIITCEHFKVIIKSRVIADGCGGLINSMGFYDPNNMRLIKELCREGIVQCFFDIGANIGIYSLIPDESIQVYAFEPHPYTFTLLNENVELNKRYNIHTIRKALDNREGSIDFSDRPGSTTNRIVRAQNQEEMIIAVETIKEDTFCKRRGRLDIYQ